jgi:multidrug efflux pump subunit AcrB
MTRLWCSKTSRAILRWARPIIAAPDGTQEVALPVVVSTSTTMIVFLPVLFLKGVGRFLFTPLAITVALAMAAS